VTGDSGSPDPASGDGEGSAVLSGDGEGTSTIRLLGVPVAIWSRAHESGAELIREFTLIALGDAPGGRDLPQRLVSLLRQMTASYGNLGEAQTKALQQAALAGEETVDELVYELPPSAATAAVELALMLDECDEYCRAGKHLLTLAAEPDVRAFRWWFLGEVRAQASGEPPTPWAESLWALSLD
jgi:hypothetical protein